MIAHDDGLALPLLELFEVDLRLRGMMGSIMDAVFDVKDVFVSRGLRCRTK